MARPRKDEAPDLAQACELTAGAIDRLTCPAGKTQAFLRDTKAPSLRVRVTAAGAKAYVFESKLNRQNIRRTIGDPCKARGLMMTSRYVKRAAVGVLAATATLGAGLAEAVGVPGQGIWESSLQARDLDGNAVNGPEAFYDTVLDITWLRDANVNGGMGWDTAVTWAAGLDVNGIKGWRLPTMIDTGAPGCDGSDGVSDCGINVRTKSGNPTMYETGQTVYSEMAHLFYVTLGNKASAGGALTNTGSFQNLLGTGPYWLGLEYVSDPSSAWIFVTSFAYQGVEAKQYLGVPPVPNEDNLYPAMAVRPGDVAAIPEPQTYAMLLLGLAGVMVAVRRRAG